MNSPKSLLAAAVASVALTATPGISDAKGGRGVSIPKIALPTSRRAPSAKPNTPPQPPRAAEVTRGVSL